ncbi:hypothetical protein IWQ60_005635 [Tieghemiomyces parasiticus]|uniref:NELF-A N-terminal domain-containing protein n=1 Tax=Tieghemiomyces parasiticus TaxID=78921 RepID=A0A9W8ABE3_9FUNG|nr:hypothetical protein IWQ60_005635 [Tieghemiomyces parasiticus]
MATESKAKVVQDWLIQVHNTRPSFEAAEFVSSELTPDSLPAILSQWADLEPGVKLTLLFSALAVKKATFTELKEPLVELFKQAAADSDSWVSVIGHTLRTYPQNGTISSDCAGLRELRDGSAKILRGGRMQVYPREYGLLNPSVRRGFGALASDHELSPGTTTAFNVREKARVSHTDRLDAIRRAAKEAANTAKPGMFAPTALGGGPAGRGAGGKLVSPTYPGARPGPLGRTLSSGAVPTAVGMAPPGAAGAAASALFNRRKPATASFLRPAAPKVGAVHKGPAGGARAQKQSRIQMLDLDEAQSINKQQEESKLRTLQNEAQERENRKLEAKKKLEERKAQEQEMKRELKREREEKKLQRQRAMETKRQSTTLRRRSRTEVDEAEEEDGAVSDGDSDTPAGPATITKKRRRLSRRTSTSNDGWSGDEHEEYDPAGGESGPTLTKAKATSAAPVPGSDLPDYEDEDTGTQGQAAPVENSTHSPEGQTAVVKQKRATRATRGLRPSTKSSESPSSPVEAAPSAPVPATTAVASAAPTPASADPYTGYPPEVRNLLSTIFRNSNSLAPDHRRIITEFLTGAENHRPPPLDATGVFRAALHQDRMWDASTQSEVIEWIEFEIDYNNGHWRQVKRRTPAV